MDHIAGPPPASNCEAFATFLPAEQRDDNERHLQSFLLRKP